MKFSNVILLTALTSLMSYPAFAEEYDIEELEEKCENGSEPESCKILGDIYAVGDDDLDVDEDFLRAAKYYNLACDAKISGACDALIVDRAEAEKYKSYSAPADLLAVLGKIGAPGTNYEEVFNFLKDKCEKGKDPYACGFYGEFLIQGIVGRKVINKGMRFLKGACRSGDPSACANLGTRLMVGEGVDIDDFKSYYTLKYACDNDFYQACRISAIFYEKRIGLKKDQKKIRELYDKACFNDDGVSCYKLGTSYINQPTSDKKKKLPALKAFVHGCELGNAQSCNAAGLIFEHGELVKNDYTQAFRYYLKGCEGDLADSCKNLGYCYSLGYGTDLDKGLSKEAYSKACELGDDESCSVAAQMYDLNQE